MEEVKALRRCSNIRLLTIEADKPSVWNVEDATHIRVSLPANIQYLYEMQKMGYQFVERMLHVTIPLSKSSIEYDRLIRIKPVALHDHKEEIKEIARSSFTSDRRFHVTLQYDQKIANEIIDSWIDEINEFYVSEYKGKIIGFLALKEQDCGKCGNIHLAAVDERYRMTGAALSLYANTVLVGRERGYQRIEGCIASTNMAVMNLYSYLGATFSEPVDIYLKEVCQ